MDNNKIAFITCVNDETMYSECLMYIRNLRIPNDYEIELVPIRDAKSITSAYNSAIKQTDAKYKVYLHQDTLIVNKNFIEDILEIFSKNNDIGMIGLTGAKNIPTNGIWWESKQCYGEVYESHTGTMQLLSFKKVEKCYEEVKAIDGFIMITQYDVPWREDIFDGWHFYDISQSIEFGLNGYKVIVPTQKKPWSLHDCGLLNTENGHEEYRQKFLQEYSTKIFPLVSILIPTYNRPEYFKLALDSVINQTYKNIEIIIGDDSTNNETEELVFNEYLNKYDNIKYYHNEKNIGQFDNDLKLMKLANGKYINFLMDDDLFKYNKIEKMMNYFINDFNEEISLVTSHRAVINENSKYGGIFGETDLIFNKDVVLTGEESANFLLQNNFNYIGEPTTVLFRKCKLTESFGILNGIRYGCNVDIASWLNLLSNGNMVFINECLSFFRRFEGQQSATDKMKVLGAIDYINEILTSRENGFLDDDDEYKLGINNCVKYCEMILHELKNKYKKGDCLIDYIKLEKKYKILEIKKNEITNIYEHINENTVSKKIEFVVYGNNNKKCIEYIKKLDIPNKYEISIKAIKEKRNKAIAYDRA
ncbi:MAG: glycosyltransferase, partial [Clostridium butyricum]|nr:glycosyltransferase [Clostridium butyricum]